MEKTPYSHRPKKQLGQNFLVDNNIIHKIIAIIQPKSHDRMVEVGPGLAALTAPLLDYLERLDVVEYDKDIITFLNEKYKDEPRLVIHQSDALKFDFSSVEANQAQTKLRVVGNLPYQISTPLIFHLLSYSQLIQDMTFMLQKEVVDRMVAEPGTKTYGRLSVMVQYFCKASKRLSVPKGAFNPPPKVESAIVTLVPYHHDSPHPRTDEELLRTLTTLAFNQRRKTIRNALKSYVTAEGIEAAGIDANLRGEKLSLNDFINLTNFVKQNPISQN